MAGPVTVVVTVQSRGAMTGFQLIQLAARRMAANVRNSINSAGNTINGRLSGIRTVATRAFSAVGTAASRATAAIMEMAPALREGAAGFAQMAGKMLLAVSVGVHMLPTLIDLLGIVVLLPAALAGAAVAMGVVKLATNGLGDAISDALTDFGKWEKANKNLPRWTHDFVAAIVRVRDAWKPLQRAIQNRFLRELGADIMELNAQYFPVFSRWLPRIADGMNAAIRKTIEWFTSSERVARIEGIMRNVSAAITSLGRVLQPIASMLLDLVEVGAPRLASLSDTLGTMAEKAAAWMTKMKDDGSIGRWLDKAIEGFSDIGEIVGNLVGIMSAMYQGATAEGETFLDGIRRQTEAMREWSESAEGQQTVSDFSAAGGIILKILTVITQSFLGLVYIVKAIYNAFNQFLIFVLNVLNTILQAAAKAFGWIPGIGPKLQQAAAEFNGFVADVNGALNGIETVRNIRINATATLTQRTIEVVSRIEARASGGLATGLIKVGERGEELIDVGAHTARVRNAGDTRQAMAGGGGNGGSGSGSGDWRPASGNSLGLAAGAINDLMRYALNGPVKAVAGPDGRVRVV